MSSRPTPSNEPLGNKVLRLESEVRYLRGLVNQAFRATGYVLFQDNTGLYVRNTNTNVDTFIAPP